MESDDKLRFVGFRLGKRHIKKAARKGKMKKHGSQSGYVRNLIDADD